MIEQLKNAGVIAIVRGVDSTKIRQTAQALLAGGVRAVEITFNTPGAAEMLVSLKSQFSDQMLLGAGTILDAQTAEIAIEAGADFLLSPCLNQEMIALCTKYGKVPVPGVMTPTEIVQARLYGAKIVKIFPAVTVGCQFFSQVLGPLENTTMMAVGGITTENMRAFLDAGASCVGVGSNLVDAKLVQENLFERITERAKQFTAKLAP